MSAVALAGRRVDAPGEKTPRFALADRQLVAERLDAVLAKLRPQSFISSAAAGADLLGLEAARRRGARTTIILPFDADRFERISVADRPGDWPKLYREMLAVSEVVTLPGPFADNDAAYAAVTEELLVRAIEAGGVGGTTAVVVWDGVSRGDDDMTAQFADRAKKLKIGIEVVPTRP